MMNQERELHDWFARAGAEIEGIDRQDRLQGRRFNLFRILRIDRKEVQTHSRLIAALLDPDGSHDQGGLFLETFLDHFSEPLQQSLGQRPCATGSWKVVTEEFHRRPTPPDIRLDIVLRRANPPLVIVIENKVDHQERDRQCADYADHLRDAEQGERALLYLTPDGRPAQSMVGRENEYARISYQDIADWMETARQRCPESIRGTLLQYSRLARLLRHATGGWTMSDEGPIVEYLSKKENLPYTLRIASSIDAIRESLLDQFFTQVKHAAREELGSLASRWMPPRDDLSMRRPYFEWPFIENAALYASVQVCGPEEEVRLGVAWRQERPTEELVPDAAQPLHSLLVKEMGPEGETDSWWLRSVSRPGPVDDVCLSAASEGELARDIGRELGRVMAAAESHIEIANKELR